MLFLLLIFLIRLICKAPGNEPKRVEEISLLYSLFVYVLLHYLFCLPMFTDCEETF